MLVGIVGLVFGAAVMRVVDERQIVQARQGEMQANGLESECKSTLKGREFETRMDEQENGDYQLSVYGGRRMVCEEKDVRVVRQPDTEEPLVIECKH